MEWNQTTDQTKKIREETNKKIKELGNKYFMIRNLFDKMNIKRDNLFLFGKQLEEQYKNVKKDIALHGTKKRLKDALLCWFADHFFYEIFDPNSNVLKQLVEFTINSNSQSQTNEKKYKITVTHDLEKETGKRGNITNEYHILNFDDVEINQEIDSFDYSNISKRNSQQKNEITESTNFDYAHLLQF